MTDHAETSPFRNWVLNTPHRVYGYVAGMTERERARQRRQRRQAA